MPSDHVGSRWHRRIQIDCLSLENAGVAILIVCEDEERLKRLKEAVHAAGFTLISAQTLQEAWFKTDYFDIDAVVIDHELQYDIATSTLGQKYITIKLEKEATPQALVMELSNILRRGSELVQ